MTLAFQVLHEWGLDLVIIVFGIPICFWMFAGKKDDIPENVKETIEDVNEAMNKTFQRGENERYEDYIRRQAIRMYFNTGIFVEEVAPNYIIYHEGTAKYKDFNRDDKLGLIISTKKVLIQEGFFNKKENN